MNFFYKMLSIDKINFLNIEVLGNTLFHYLQAVLIFFIIVFVLFVLRKVVVKKLLVAAESTSNLFDDFFIKHIAKERRFFFSYLAFFMATWFLNIEDFYADIFYNIFLILLIFETISFLQVFISFFLKNIVKGKDKSSMKALEVIGKFLGWILWGLGFVFLISNLGVDVTALLTGLGIGGIAIAFALKSVLTDLFSYITILLDKPIEEGDNITVEGKSGVVKSIGIKTTRLVGTDGREVVVSNDKISSGILDNINKRDFRRQKFSLRFPLEISIDKIGLINDKIQILVESKDNTIFKRSYLKSILHDALSVEVDYTILITDYDQYSKILEEINLGILSILEEEDVRLQYPTQHVLNESK